MSSDRSRSLGQSRAAFVLLLLPVLVYLCVFVIPVANIGYLSVDNRAFSQAFSQTAAAEGEDHSDAVATALYADIKAASRQQLGEIARLLNKEVSGFRSLILNTGKHNGEPPRTLAELASIDARWSEPGYIEMIRERSGALTGRNFVDVLGLNVSGEAETASARAERSLYLDVLFRTFLISLQVSALTVIIGYIIAYAASNSSRAVAAIIIALVMMSFWTSILVRTSAWLVLLQTNGIVNNALIALGLITQPLQLIFNRFGAVLSMTHVLLPFAILPIMNVMKTIPASQRDASRSLGAGRIKTFIKVYLPQSMRGVAVGFGTVYILCLGFYITPALTGGASDQMLAYFISDFVNRTLDWGMASALSVVLLLAVASTMLIGKLIYGRIFGGEAR